MNDYLNQSYDGNNRIINLTDVHGGVYNQYYVELRSSFAKILTRAIKTRAGKEYSTAITNGNNPITRFEAAALLVRAYEALTGRGVIPDYASRFADIKNEDSNLGTIQKAVALNLFVGEATKDGTNFYPDRWMPRAQVVSVIERLVNKLNEEKGSNEQITQLTIKGQAAGWPHNLSLTAKVQIHPQDKGKNNKIYVAARVNGQWFEMVGLGNWRAFSGTPNVNACASDTCDIEILSNTDVRPFKGAEVYVGYGENLQDMLNNGKFRLVHTLYSED